MAELLPRQVSKEQSLLEKGEAATRPPEERAGRRGLPRPSGEQTPWRSGLVRSAATARRCCCCSRSSERAGARPFPVVVVIVGRRLSSTPRPPSAGHACAFCAGRYWVWRSTLRYSRFDLRTDCAALLNAATTVMFFVVVRVLC